MESVWRDLRYAFRTLTRNPGFTLTVVLSLGVGVGANTTVFAWMDSIVRHPFPAIPRGGELVALNVAELDGRVDGMPPIAYPVLEEWQSRASSFSRIAAHSQTRLNLRTAPADAGEPIWVEIVSAAFFDTVEVQAFLGRVFDERDEASQAAVVVVSHALWQRRLGGAADVIGRSILLNGVPLTIVGVAAPRFTGVVMGLGFDAWVPLWQQPGLITGTDWVRDRAARRMQAVARLRPGVTLGQASQELNTIAQEVSRSFGESPRTGAAARWVSETQLGSLMGPLSLAMIAVTAVVLLTACANVAGLLLARSAAGRRQTAIQCAVGATRSRLIQQGLVQSVMLGALGSMFGIVLAQAAKGALLAFVPNVALPVNLDIELGWRVLVFAMVVAVVGTLLFAILPALGGSRVDLVESLKSSSGRAGGSPSRMRQVLVVAQVSLTLVSLVIAGLFLRSVAAASRVPLGFGDSRQVLLVSTDLSFTRLEGRPLVALVDRAVESVRRVPGVAEAAFSSMVPLGFGGPPRVNTRIDGYVPAPNEPMLVARASVSAGYFETMQMPIVDGRSITATDREGALRVVIVNEALAARYWPGQRSLGRRIDQGDGWAMVVGVVRNAAIDSVTDPPGPLAFHPLPQSPTSAVTLHARTLANPLLVSEAVRRELAATHADLPAMDPRTLAAHMQAATFVQSVGATVFSVFGVITLLIASVGLYGVVTQVSAERRREFAIIAALGATPRMVVYAVLKPALVLTACGLGCGAALAAAAATLVQGQLVGVGALDLASIAGSTVLVVVAVIASCIWPICQALRLDTMAAIRTQ